ncbi:CASP-like protein [Musa troglodytarum]|uniref:CASP-like protein n=1 Tax=Musa troglodytarum TaxID=320322 RepID=A0A9E7EA75_9LILI|nr:CASP-like protein [Musa troglodytarum]
MSTSEAAPSATAITIDDSDARGKAPAAAPAPAAPPPAAPAPAKDRRFPFLLRKTKVGGGACKRGVACFDFLLRLCAIAATLVAAIIMGTTDETLPFFTQFFQFHANYADLPALTSVHIYPLLLEGHSHDLNRFFVVGNAIAAGYLVLSLPFSLAAMVRPQAIGPRLLLFVLDTVMMELTIAAASSATAIVYLAHNGSSKANWVAICLRFDGFCQSISGAVVASFIAVVFFMVLVVMSALVMRKQ